MTKKGEYERPPCGGLSIDGRIAYLQVPIPGYLSNRRFQDCLYLSLVVLAPFQEFAGDSQDVPLATNGAEDS